MKRIELTLLFLISSWTISARMPSLYFQHFPGNDGLHPRIFCIAQDQEEFLWLGSSEGLLRFDGNTYEEIHRIESIGAPLCNATTLLYMQENGDIIFGAENGLQIYNNDTGSIIQVTSLSDKKIKDIFRFNGHIFISTNQGLYQWKFDPGGNESPDYLTAAPEKFRALGNQYISCAAVIGHDLFLGTYDQIYHITADWQLKKSRLPQLNRNGRNLVLRISADPQRKDRLWIGSEYGLVRWEIETGQSSSYLHDTPSKSFLIHEDQLWIGTDNGLYIKDDKDRFNRYIHEADRIFSLSNNVIWALFEDRRGNIFIGTDLGLNLVGVKSPLTRYTVGKSQKEINTQCICIDDRSNLYIGGTDGLFRIDADSGTVTEYSTSADNPRHRISHNKVKQLHYHGNTVWISNDGGIDRLNTRTGNVTHLKLEGTDRDQSFSNWTYSTKIDPAGKLWAATYNGLLVIDPEQRAYRHYFQNQSIGDICIGEDVICVKNTLDDNTTVLLDPETLEIELELDNVKSNDIAGDGKHFYIATDHGVIVLNPDHSYHHIDGLNSPISNLDVNGDRLVAFNSKNIFLYDGKHWKSCRNPESAITCIKAVNDSLAICGSIDCFYVLEYDKIPEDETIKAPVVTRLLVGNKEIRPQKAYRKTIILPHPISQMEEIVLNPGVNTISLVFARPEYNNSRWNYAYRLKGFNEEWIYTTNQKADFINIPAGHYEFEVKIVLKGGDGDSPARTLGIRIPPMWYNTTWAHIMYILLFLSVSAGIMRFLHIQHQLRKERRERENALESIRVKNRFLENISHEFKSPLSIIMGTVGKMTVHTSDAVNNKDVVSLKNNAEKIYHLIDKMIEMNGNGAGQLFVPVATSLYDMVLKSYNDMLPAFKEKSISTRFISEDIRYIFMLDRMKMESAITNLLSNALKFTPAGGDVLVSVKNVKETEDKIYAEISVEDNGIGIMPGDLSHIFEHYYMAESNREMNPNGSGIGLYLCRQVVEMHNGQISASSEYGKGSRFSIRLSTLKTHSFLLSSSQDEDLSIHNLSSIWNHERRPNILIAEDNDDIRNMIVESLGEDYNFFPVKNGLEALDVMKNDKTDLVITDLIMPEMDGLKLCQKIKSSLKTAFVPIIILTGKINEKTRLKAYEFSDAFIPKPFNMNYLNSCIIQLLIKHEEYLQKLRQTQLLQPEVEQLDSREGRLMEEVVNIINRHLDDPELTVSVLCKESHYSNKQIYRYLKEKHGMTIVEFIREIRLRKAASYIEQDRLTISEIMYMVGFTTPSYFSKCFKEKYGVSPSEYHGETELVKKNQ